MTAPTATPLPGIHPYVGQDLVTLLDDRVGRRGDHPFLVWSPPDAAEQTWTYAEMAVWSDAVAAQFSRQGVGLRDRVLVLLDNRPESVVALLACARLGATAVMANARSVADEIAYVAGHADVVLAVTDASRVELVRSVCPDLAVIDSAGLASLPDDTVARRDGDPALDVLVQYTSGTTARPKGVVWTHANALWAGQINARHTGLRPDDVYLVHLPLFHTNALGYSTLGTMWAGGTMVLLPRFSASRFWEVSLRHGCTVTSMIPFAVKAIAAQPVPEGHRYRTWGSAICDPPYDSRFGVKSVGWWGMTETVSHGIVGDDGLANTPMTCGRPAPEYELRIVDEHGAAVPVGVSGGLRIKGVPGVSLFSRYLNDPDATAAAFDDDGYFLTGDRVTMLPTGHIRFDDRDKDMLKVGGENVAASEVERVVLSVTGVAEAAVVARPDPMLFEVPVAFVVLAPSVDPSAIVDAVLTECRVRLASFKAPREVYVVDDLPRATLNKIAKNVLRDQLMQGAT
jgi:carnitine-CoA ligase